MRHLYVNASIWSHEYSTEIRWGWTSAVNWKLWSTLVLWFTQTVVHEFWILSRVSISYSEAKMKVAQQGSVFTQNWYAPHSSIMEVGLWITILLGSCWPLVQINPVLGGGQNFLPFWFLFKLYKNRKTCELKTLSLFLHPRDQSY